MVKLPDGWRIRRNWRGKLILQRREASQVYKTHFSTSIFSYRWVDASLQDWLES